MGTALGIEGYSGPTTVAVKQLKANADENEKREFLAEMDIMKQVGNQFSAIAFLEEDHTRNQGFDSPASALISLLD